MKRNSIKVWYNGKWNDEKLIQNSNSHYHHVIHNFLTPKQCDDIVNARVNWESYEGEVFDANESEVRKDIRKVNVYDMPKSLNWILEKIWSTIQKTNSKFWQYELEGLTERPMFLEYFAPDSGYAWHMDLGKKGESTNRKLLYVILLNDQFEGGDLNIFYGGENMQPLPLKKGSIILCPSYTLHQVSEVTKGTRYAIIGWAGGDTFR
jgi:PKHD-type hydroxylase